MGPAPRVEHKVWWSTVWAYLGAVALLAVLQAVSDDPSMLTPLPDLIEVPLVAVLPAAIGGLAGYVTRHTARPDLPIAKR